MSDGLANFNLFVKYMRLRAVVRLDVFPTERDTVDLVLLALMGVRA